MIWRFGFRGLRISCCIVGIRFRSPALILSLAFAYKRALAYIFHAQIIYGMDGIIHDANERSPVRRNAAQKISTVIS